MTLENLQSTWLGRKVHATSDHQLGTKPTHTITEVRHNPPGRDDESFVAWSVNEAGMGEHILCSTAASLDRRLHQLAGSGS